MWGKWAQNENKTHTTIVESEKTFYELLTCAGTEVTQLTWHGSLGNIPSTTLP